MRVLVFECDLQVPGELFAWLASEGHSVEVVSDPLAAIAQPDTAAPDVLVLSAIAGSEEALDLCRELRRSTSVPILVVGDSTEVEASIRALDAGADDYLAPTISQRETLARFHALGRRASAPGEAYIVRVGDLRIYPHDMKATLRGQEMRLRPQECGVLLVLARHPGVLFSAEDLLERARCRSSQPSTISVHLVRIRDKLRGSDVRVENVRGHGFRLAVKTDRQL
jgi:two-component system response regulator MtrA